MENGVLDNFSTYKLVSEKDIIDDLLDGFKERAMAEYEDKNFEEKVRLPWSDIEKELGIYTRSKNWPGAIVVIYLNCLQSVRRKSLTCGKQGFLKENKRLRARRKRLVLSRET